MIYNNKGELAKQARVEHEVRHTVSVSEPARAKREVSQFINMTHLLIIINILYYIYTLYIHLLMRACEASEKVEHEVRHTDER